MKREGRSHPANNQNRAFGESSPGLPRKRTSSIVDDLYNQRSAVNSHEKEIDTRIDPLLPLHDFVPSAFVQEVVDLDHSLDVFLWGFPAFAHEGIVELLRGGVLPDAAAATVGRSGAGDRRSLAVGWKGDALVVCRGVREVQGDVVEWIERTRINGSMRGVCRGAIVRDRTLR